MYKRIKELLQDRINEQVGIMLKTYKECGISKQASFEDGRLCGLRDAQRIIEDIEEDGGAGSE